MVTTETVLILGAGASKTYRYPLGYELYQRACRDLMENNHIISDLIELGFDQNAIKKFGTALQYSQAKSIDAFVQTRSEYEDIAKLTISLLLLPLEREAHLLHTENESWYRWLWHQMRGLTLEDYSKNKISFVTFNYDRSLEHFLFTALKNTYAGVSDEEVKEVMDKTPIIHVYGNLCNLPWQEGNSREYIRPKRNEICEQAKKSASSIRLLYEDRKSDNESHMAYKAMANADRGFFLGFGYDDTNLANLAIELHNPSKFRGTVIGLTDLEIEEIKGKHKVNLGNEQHRSIQEYFEEEVGSL